MIADWGLPLQRQADLLTVAAAYIDLAKIAVGIGALLPSEILQQKLDYTHAVASGWATTIARRARWGRTN